MYIEISLGSECFVQFNVNKMLFVTSPRIPSELSVFYQTFEKSKQKLHFGF